MSDLTAIDAYGHIIERESDIRKYLKEPWNRRSTPLRPGDQPWDNHMFESFQSEQVWGKLSPREQVARWIELMDEHHMETAICFPTGSGSIVRLQEVPFQIAVARACNDHFAAEYNAHSDRVKCVGVLPMRSPQAAAEELERAVKERGIIGFEILPPGLPVALGDSFYDPVYAAAEKCGAVLGIHGTRSWSREFGAEGLNTFAEVHAYAFTAGILLQFTSMICQGVPVRFPKLRLAFLLVALLFRSARRALGKTCSVRNAVAQRKAQRIGEKIGGLLQHRIGRVAVGADDRIHRRRTFRLCFGYSALGL
jgi:predicted TIM-barrel fold metal-dependent hydrolase